MTSTRRAELQQTGELQSGELRKNLLINLGFMRRFCFVHDVLAHAERDQILYT